VHGYKLGRRPTSSQLSSPLQAQILIPGLFPRCTGAYNLVQGPSNYHNLLRMGVPANRLVLAGHWIPKDVVDNIEFDCELRKERTKAGQPIRILIPVGGAGAQKTFVTTFVKTLKGHVQAGKVQLFLNAADHDHMRVAFLEAIAAIGAEYTVVDSMPGVYDFAERLRAGQSPPASITLFTFKDYFPAVATTDVLVRVSDVRLVHRLPILECALTSRVGPVFFSEEVSLATVHHVRVAPGARLQTV